MWLRIREPDSSALMCVTRCFMRPVPPTGSMWTACFQRVSGCCCLCSVLICSQWILLTSAESCSAFQPHRRLWLRRSRWHFRPASLFPTLPAILEAPPLGRHHSQDRYHSFATGDTLTATANKTHAGKFNIVIKDGSSWGNLCLLYYINTLIITKNSNEWLHDEIDSVLTFIYWF